MSNDVLCFKGKYNITINIVALCIPSVQCIYRHSTQYHWDSREREQKKEVYSSQRIPFSQDSTKSQNWVREKNQQTTFLWILNTWMNVNQAKWQLWIVCQSINLAARGFYQWFIITVQTKSWFGSWNVSNIRIVCLALFSYLVFNCA